MSASRAGLPAEVDLERLADPLEVPYGGRASGTLSPPPSKSVSHRYLNLCLLVGRSVRIERLLLAEDIEHFSKALEVCGFSVDRLADAISIQAPASTLTSGDTRQSKARSAERAIFCGNAGTMYRFLIASLATLPGRWRLDGTARLRQRPVGPLVDSLRQLGVAIEYLGTEGYAPLLIEGGSLVGGRCEIDASQSSQFLSALIMAGTRAQKVVEIEVEGLRSAPYVAITLDALEAFGIGESVSQERGARGNDNWRFRVDPRARLEGSHELRVEGDYSAAAYPAAAALITGGQVELRGLDRRSSQGDRQFLELLAEMGAEVVWRDEGLTVRGGSQLRALDVDLSEMPDQVPTLAALAAFCDGTTSIRNVPHLRIKESDRLRAMALELTKAQVKVDELADGLRVHGRPEWRTQPFDKMSERAMREEDRILIDPYDDHRIAMSLALVGLRRPGVAISNPRVVAKSYPGFWRDLDHLLSP